MPIEISDWNDLDDVRNGLTADYVLVNDLDENTNGYAGVGDDFEPIGVRDSDGDAFAGTFDGDGFAIEDLIVDIDPTERGVGLFGGTLNDGVVVVENLSVSGSVTNADTDFNETGGLVGRHDGGIIQNCVSHVDVIHQGNYAGGLVGFNNDTVTDSYATGSVEGDDLVGGLVGQNRDTVTDSYATGSVEGNEGVGGLVGENLDTVTDSYATGSVEGNEGVGGLVGDNSRTVTDSYATGSVEGGDRAGGLVGQAGTGSTIDKTYSLGDVTGGDNVGGLYGKGFTTDVSESYAVGNVTGDTNVGGFAGDGGDGNRERNYFDTESTTQSDAFGDSDGGGGVTALTTAEMQGSEAETNMGFDFSNVWSLVEEEETLEIDGLVPEEDGYPILLSVDLENQLDAQNIALVSLIFTAFVQVNGVSKQVTDAFVQINGQAVDASTAFTQVNDDVREI